MTQTPTRAGAATADQLIANAEIATEFLAKAAAGRAREAWEQCGAPDFVHHNPYFAADAESLISAMDENARANPEKRLEIMRTVAEGDHVVVHSRVRQRSDDRGAAVVHIFRIEGGRIRELWDIGQEVPENSPNQAGMF
jgi:predicted SnoaL-like aldol condensation-catalyzing enzyme